MSENSIPIIAAEEINDFSGEVLETVQELLKKSVFRQLSINKIDSDKITELHLESFTPLHLSTTETTLLQSLVEELRQSLKNVKMTI